MLHRDKALRNPENAKMVGISGTTAIASMDNRRRGPASVALLNPLRATEAGLERREPMLAIGVQDPDCCTVLVKKRVVPGRAKTPLFSTTLNAAEVGEIFEFV